MAPYPVTPQAKNEVKNRALSRNEKDILKRRLEDLRESAFLRLFYAFSD